MAKLILKPIGSSIFQDSIFLENQKIILEKEALIEEKRKAIRAGWGIQYQERVHAKAKMSTWERLEALSHQILPIHTFIQTGSENKEAPAAGVITAFCHIENRWCMVIANDNTVASGSWWPKTPEKIIRAQEIALKLKLPVIYLVDCSGLYLPEQAKSFPGQRGAGKIFKMNSLLSNAGIPQITGVFGDCIAGGGYMPIISDKVYMTEQAYMVIAGAALIQGAKSQNLSSLDIGGPRVHVHLSNCADQRVPDDLSCLKKIREDIKLCSSSAVSYYRSSETSEPCFNSFELQGILAHSPTQSYDIRQVIARLIDDSLFGEFFEHTGHEVITGIAKISGLYVGIAANVQGLLPHPQNPAQKRPGGILYKEGVAKLATFARACDADGIPLIWLQDVSGFDVGLEAEKQGLLGYGSSLIYANSNITIPVFTILLRKASGAGYYAMSGLPYDPVLQLSTSLSRLAVMEGKTLALGAFNTRPGELESMQRLASKIESDMDPFKAAAQMDTDEVVKLCELHKYLNCLVECSYQSQGTRRIKNPRIWSLHDLNILSAQVFQEHPHKPRVQKSPVLSQTDIINLTEPEQVFRAPLDGLFYLKASPKAPPFVQVEQIIKPGDTLGLIEVMKCFHPIRYDGNSPKTVKSILIQDASPVKTGEIILQLKSL